MYGQAHDIIWYYEMACDISYVTTPNFYVPSHELRTLLLISSLPGLKNF